MRPPSWWYSSVAHETSARRPAGGRRVVRGKSWASTSSQMAVAMCSVVTETSPRSHRRPTSWSAAWISSTYSTRRGVPSATSRFTSARQASRRPATRSATKAFSAAASTPRT